MDYEELGNQLMTTPIPGVYVPLRQVADVTPSWQPIGLAHLGGENSITVFADMRKGNSQPKAIKVIKKYIGTFAKLGLIELLQKAGSELYSRLGPPIHLQIILRWICQRKTNIGFARMKISCHADLFPVNWQRHVGLC